MSVMKSGEQSRTWLNTVHAPVVKPWSHGTATHQNTWKFKCSFNFERVHPVVFILMYWIYLLPSTQQTFGYNGFTRTCFDSHELSSGYVQNPSVLAVLLLTVFCSGGCWSVWSGGWPYTYMNENLNELHFLIHVFKFTHRIHCSLPRLIVLTRL
jgi:hypothetical protein